MVFSFLRITSSAGQKSYPSISSTLIQRISLCSSFWGVPSRIDALNKVRWTVRSGYSWTTSMNTFPTSSLIASSTVLSSLVCSLKPNILHLFSDTGCEYPETLSFVGAERHRGKNIVSVHPICRDGSIWTFERIVATYGYPLFSKAIANGIRTYRHAKTPVTKQHALDYLERMYPQALPYLNCNISDLCCEKLKKSPLKRVAKHMQMQCSIIGTLAEESQIRKRDWITYGSNIFFQKKDNQCRPLSFWTNQDIWDYIKLCNLPVSDLYSQGYQRNGCMYCGFGLCSERRKFGINRFERLAQTHPKQYEYMISRWASLFKECGIPY